MQVRYLLFLSRSWLSSEDAGIHGLYIFYHQAKQLVAETKHELRDGEKQEDGQTNYRATPNNKEQSKMYMSLHIIMYLCERDFVGL